MNADGLMRQDAKSRERKIKERRKILRLKSTELVWFPKDYGGQKMGV
jgi:hypothetical protein